MSPLRIQPSCMIGLLNDMLQQIITAIPHRHESNLYACLLMAISSAVLCSWVSLRLSSFLRRCYSYRSLQRLIIVNYRSTSQCGPAEPGVFLFDLIPPRVALCLFSSASWYLASGSSSYLREPNVAPLSSSYTLHVRE